MDVALIVAGFVMAVCLTEVALKGRKLQTGLATVILVHIGVAGLLLVYFFVVGRPVWDALLIFWAGAFLTSFGVRSHVESSILLRMLYLLRKGTLSGSHLLQEYESQYGKAQRLENLFRGGLLKRSPEGAIVTWKGKLILRVVSLLK
jgi:hypothetical protein